MDHGIYDQRHYPIVDVQQGYGEWVRTYEQVVQDEMDLRLFERVTTVDWAARDADSRSRVRHWADRGVAEGADVGTN